MAKKDYSEDLLIQAPTAELLEKQLGWQSVLAYNEEDFGPDSLLGRASDAEVVLTREPGGTPLAERIRVTVKEKELKKRSTGETLGFVTISVGVATYHRGDTAISLIERADTALYLAKRAGRNRVCTEAMLSTSASEEA